MRGKSLNPHPTVIQYIKLLDRFRATNKELRQSGIQSVNIEDWIAYNSLKLYTEVYKPVNKLEYYQSVSNNARGKYMNY